MYNFLSEKEADYTAETLTLAPSEVLVKRAAKKQTAHKLDNGGLSVIDEATDSAFTVVIKWDYLTAANQATILDLWQDPDKANGMEKTFYWKDPQTEKIYTVRFLSDLTSNHYPHDYIGIQDIVLAVEGKAPA